LQNGTLGGTITNNLPYGLNDAYVLVANQFINLGHLDAGQTRQISTAITAGASSSNTSLADQIAASHGLPVPYTPNTTGNTHEENEYQRHAAVLSTMSGENSGFVCVNGGICSQQAAPSSLTKQIAINGRGTSSSNEQDPLLLPNTAATLIGWVGNNATPANNIMINGTNAQGVQESLLQAPLDVTYDGDINVPADFITSRLTDVQSQGSNIQTQFPGVYTLSTGSMTFEFALPAMQHLRTNMLTFTENTNIVNGIGNIGNGNGNINMPGDLSHIHTYLYNWQTHQWDNVSFNQNTLTLQNAQVYANEDGRIFMQFSNQDSTQGTTLLTRPTLQLQGQVSR
jgi:hypothetical protein